MILPYPPSANRYWRHNRGRTHVSSEARNYREVVSWRVKADNGAQRHTESERLSLTINVYPPDRRRRDLDNTLKVTLDALQHAGVYADDSQIDQLTVTRCGLGGYIEIQTEAL